MTRYEQLMLLPADQQAKVFADVLRKYDRHYSSRENVAIEPFTNPADNRSGICLMADFESSSGKTVRQPLLGVYNDEKDEAFAVSRFSFNVAELNECGELLHKVLRRKVAIYLVE